MRFFSKKKCEIWAIGGGKGGVGKSFILSSVGTSLANSGNRVVLIDADLGGANLHTFLGVHKPRVSLTDFFDNKIPLSELIVDSGIRNMGLLTGAIGSLAPESIKYAQKLKFFSHIKKLEADYVLVDLGAGTTLNTVDTFLLADKMVIVITPEIISIENMYYFLKNVLFRKLILVMAEKGHKDVVSHAWKHRSDYNITTFKQLLDHLRNVSRELRAIIKEELCSFTINIILNQAKDNQDAILGNSVKSICKKHFGISAQYTGYVEHDDFITRSVNQRQPYMISYPNSRCAQEIDRLTQNLLDEKQITIIN